MPGSSPDTIIPALLICLGRALRPHGYRRRGRTFIERNDGFARIINVQTYNGRFTVNVGLLCEAIIPYDGLYHVSDRTPRECDCHWRVRLGHFLGTRADLWWPISDDPVALAEYLTVLALIEQRVVPVLASVTTLHGFSDFITANRAGLFSTKVAERVHVAIEWVMMQQAGADGDADDAGASRNQP